MIKKTIIFFILLSGVVFLFGCSGSSDPKSDGSVNTSSGDLAKEIVGSWKSESDSDNNSGQASAAQGGDSYKTADMPYQSNITMTYTFDDNGTFKQSVTSESLSDNGQGDQEESMENSGTYSVNGDTLTTKMEKINGETKEDILDKYSDEPNPEDYVIGYEPEEAKISINGDTLTIDNESLGTVSYVRVKKSK